MTWGEERGGEIFSVYPKQKKEYLYTLFDTLMMLDLKEWPLSSFKSVNSKLSNYWIKFQISLFLSNLADIELLQNFETYLGIERFKNYILFDK